ncbi:MAG: DNA translocase FtsK 4TM domain-containing protein [Ardenticatenaceae bacterium]|nr:DNA translocase FtsK 4TM domain-containing protein [Anaerolineales bacterium]MCB8920792.1 DNA translocase FtsK 4TM domain-containing protein [Ardenticatenaceae bacterium]MCB8989751.1 DNA translocase FtsK 4TM domain-containing protein [Ardenticatenaceae bacterium]MCB9002790.1 DNA translocase FtsK 4TM domain-containing protein [Ardenticatenaceae bacterium]
MARKKSPPTRTPAPAPPTWDERAINALMPWRVEIVGVGLFLFAMITILALPGWTKADWWWTKLLREIFGWGAYPLFLTVAAAGLHVALRKVERPYHIHPRQVIGLELILLTLLPLSHQFTRATLAEAHLGKGGGLVGWALSEPLLAFFGPILTGLLYLALLIGGLSLITSIGWQHVQQWLQILSQELQQFAEQIAPSSREESEESASVWGTATPDPAVPPPQITLMPDDLVIIDDSAANIQPKLRRRAHPLPPIDLLLEGGTAALTPEEIDEKKRIIEQTLHDFGLPATVTQIRRGPAVTQFGVEPGYVEKPGLDGELKQHKVRVGQIAALQKDLALALAVQRLRVQAPVPGQGVVGIEVPNDETAVVRLRPVIESDTFYKLNAPLGVGLGHDVSGAPIAIDLGKLPHLLVAGTTGSGKSVLMNALISCLVFNNTPDNLHVIMIDPKKVELIRFNGLPHLIGQVETEADRAVGVLRWLTAEMDRRYELFSAVGARNLNGYNHKAGRDKSKKLPYMAVFIDELADLMHTYPGDVERTLCRLAQMARATGIHLVVATQRPSTDVITGLIKANFPARLSFSVASGTDSRVILDSVGAEHLLGKGDMLFLAPDASGPQRVQGVFVSDPEIEAIVKHWKEALPEWEPIPCPWETLLAKFALLDETDSLLESAIEIAQKQDSLSTSYLQRRLRIGFPRAARIMEHLYEMGLVEDPKTGGKTRRSYVSEDDDPMGDLLSNQESD